jgi:aspartate kinase
VLLARSEAASALRTVHQAFGLEKEPAGPKTPPVYPTASRPDPMAIVSRLERMEELTIDEITLDDQQGRLTISGVADKPGIAAAIFDAVADAGIFVDMIVQSYGDGSKANLSFTVPQNQFDAAAKLLGKLAQQLQCGPVSSSPNVAKLSVSGIGMRSHASVAIRTFECLAAAGINVDLINTSEVRVNVIVDGRHGRQALESLQRAFADAQR